MGPPSEMIRSVVGPTSETLEGRPTSRRAHRRWGVKRRVRGGRGRFHRLRGRYRAAGELLPLLRMVGRAVKYRRTLTMCGRTSAHFLSHGGWGHEAESVDALSTSPEWGGWEDVR